MNRTLYKFIGALAAFVLAIATYSSTKASASLSNTSNAPAGYTNLIFEDNFDTFNSVWHHGHWWTREGSLSATNTNEQQAYAPANVTVSNGLLNITARKETVTVGTKTYYYTSGLVETGGDQYGYPDKFTFTYGYMEARIKIPSGQGLWPAFWLWPANYQDPPETDIMEIIGSKPQENNMTVHYTGGNTGYVYTGPDFSQDFHVYGCEWTPDYIAWFVDGVEVARFSDATRVSQQPMYLILNLAVGGDWPGPVSDSVLPATMQVDWVRVYQKSTAATSTPTAAPTNTPTPIPPTATPQATAQSLLPITYDDQNSAFVYSSGWQNVSTKNAYGGSYKQTSAQNSSVTLTFTGRSFSVLYTASSVYSR
ncbi:MAG: glycoside hydrolase family 16 protein, partial [Chloroflexi bacterium]|nr:glycoside hydrolase family 16 protein [Chloroflexota bacterium]